MSVAFRIAAVMLPFIWDGAVINWHSRTDCSQVLVCDAISSILMFVLFSDPAPIPEESRKKKGITYEELRNKHRETYEVMLPPKAETPNKFSQEKPAKEGNTLIYRNT